MDKTVVPLVLTPEMLSIGLSHMNVPGHWREDAKPIGNFYSGYNADESEAANWKYHAEERMQAAWSGMIAASVPTELCLGAKVVSEDGLYCGSGGYDWACVVSLSPLILVSEEGDMRWNHQSASKLTVIGMVSMEQFAVCVSRVARDSAFSEGWNNALSTNPVAWAVVEHDSNRVMYVDMDKSKVEAVADNKPPEKVLPLVLGK